jgi:pyruvate dehydrogenase E2 component (dihydrolipoamide acetyltransferase)
MPTNVIMPALEMAQETGRLIRWLKAEGDPVNKGEPLMEIETDKVTVEIEAPANGVLAAVTATEGTDVPVGETVAQILAPGETATEAHAAPSAPAPEPVAAVAAPPEAAPDAGGNGRRGRPLASPKARRLAAERGLDLAAVSGTGPHGAIVAADLDQAAAPETAAVPDRGEELEVGSIWRRMAERTAESWQAPHFFLTREVDAGRLLSWRETARLRDGYESVTHTDLLVKVAAEALRRHPRANASWLDGHISSSGGVNVGIAVAVDDGLVVPVIHAADRLSLREIAMRRAELVAAAREGKLRPHDVSGGTFTISNLGMYGVDGFLAIVNAPQAAILAVGRIADRVVAADGVPTVRPSVVLTLSCDHRVLDGARGAQFLQTLVALVEEPAGIVS